MLSRPARRVFLAVLLASLAVAAEPSPFEFPLPEGFVSLKQTAGIPPMTRIDDFYFEQSRGFETYAVHLGAEGVDATYRAKVWPGAAPLAPWPELAQKAVASSGLQDAQIRSTRLVQVAGVRSGRIEIDARVDGREWRQLTYLLPGRAHWAALVLTADLSEFDHAAAAMEAVLPQIRGLASVVETPNPGVVTAGDDSRAKVGATLALAAFGGYLLNKLLRRRKPPRPAG